MSRTEFVLSFLEKLKCHDFKKENVCKIAAAVGRFCSRDLDAYATKPRPTVDNLTPEHCVYNLPTINDNAVVEFLKAVTSYE